MGDSGINELKKKVQASRPLRIMICAAATAAWYDIHDERIRSEVIERFQAH
jgi:hypothetical protein